MNNLVNEKLKSEVSIFIASSKYAKEFAQTLANELEKYSGKYRLTANSWWNTASTLGSVLEELIDLTDKNDFAIVLLTSQIDSAPDVGNVDIEKKKVKYNCIYEAGLFTGALGPSKDRCFIVTSGGIEDLPSDLYGMKHFTFNEKNQDEANRQLKTISKDIGEAICRYADEKIHPVRGLKRPMISAEELFRREAHYKCGGKLKPRGALVFVNTPTPVEMESEIFANQVIKNILDFKIKYTYVFEKTETNITAIGDVISNFIDAIKRDTRWTNKFSEALKIFKKNVNIYFVAENPGLEFCVHNADSDDAQCYLKCLQVKPVMWLDWCEGANARHVANEIDRIKDNAEPSTLGQPSRLRLLRNTCYCKPCEKDTNNQIIFTDFGRDLYESISESLSGKFSTQEEVDILNACFGVIINDKQS